MFRKEEKKHIKICCVDCHAYRKHKLYLNRFLAFWFHQGKQNQLNQNSAKISAYVDLA